MHDSSVEPCSWDLNHVSSAPLAAASTSGLWAMLPRQWERQWLQQLHWGSEEGLSQTGGQ